MKTSSVSSIYLPNFKPGQVGYVGFQFSLQRQIHYGWVRVQVSKHGRNLPSLVLSEFGYESTPNTAILAGSCTASASGTGPGSGPPAEAGDSRARGENAASGHTAKRACTR
jgi:hypothetical protein